MKLKISRFNPGDKTSHYDVFGIDSKPGLTVLSALFYVQDHLDNSLSLRYSCRGAVCGSCAMLINKVPRLACRTQLEDLLGGRGKIELKPYPAIEGGEGFDPSGEVLVEPLPNLPVIKDLVVDMSRFFEYYRKVEPVLRVQGSLPKKERRMGQAAVKALEDYTNCILCASCYGACPVDAENPSYLGPAALAKLYRFHIDPREPVTPSSPSSDYRLELANRTNGWWGCQFHTNCKLVCPKDVPPNIAIGKARTELMKQGKKPKES